MDFTLKYEGRVPTGQGDREHYRQAKNALRVAFHRQLEVLFSTRWDLRGVLSQKLPVATLQGENLEVRGVMPEGFFAVERGGLLFVPLFSQERPWLIKVRVEIYRRQWLGRVLTPGGDLDNQAKTILDGLRIPQSDDEAKGLDLPPGSRCLALLENDALITAAAIESRQSLVADLPDDHASVMVYVDATPARFL